VFCANCNLYLRDESLVVERVTFTRRILGSWLLEGVLVALTLVIGWFIWLLFTAKNAQTPAKSLTGIYIVNLETGRAVGAGEVWLRDVLLKIIVANLVGIGQAIDLVWALFDRDRQALHDKAVKTVVVYAPSGLPEAMRYQPGAPARYQAPPLFPQNPPAQTVPGIGDQLRELQRLHEEHLLSDEEYERKRAELVARL
jgi:uncharacterized RDD family membrane protein YckC